MKKLLLLSLMTFSLISLMACSQKNESQQQDATSETSQATNKPIVLKGKILVAYFSASGVTKGVAEKLATACDADLYEITPEQPYTDADLDWHNDKSRSSVEMKDLTSRPAIKGKVENIQQYDAIFIGFPIWWYTAPTIINTFIETYDLKGKSVIPFATSGGSTIEKASTDLKSAYPDINWGEGKLLNDAGEDDILKWVETMK